VTPLYLGVDGGNSKTVAVVARDDGTVVGTERVVRNGDIHRVGLEAAVAVHREAVEAALAAAGARPADLDAAILSLAGADWPEDVAELEAAHRAWLPGARVVNDAIGALRATIPDGPGVVVATGTGTATGARGPSGETWHSSFWQEPQGAHALAVQSLQAVYAAELGIAPPTELTGAVLAATGAPDVETVLHRQSRRVDRWRDVDMLAPVLLDVAADGDPTARAIVRDHGASLGRTAIAAARRVGMGSDPFGLAPAGGLFRHPAPQLRDALVATVRADFPQVELVRAELEPAVGALLLAFDSAGLAVKGEREERLLGTLPASALYETRVRAS
jgi:N-acetylglucosamine kinase-like BadF-type ATPase